MGTALTAARAASVPVKRVIRCRGQFQPPSRVEVIHLWYRTTQSGFHTICDIEALRCLGRPDFQRLHLPLWPRWNLYTQSVSHNGSKTPDAHFRMTGILQGSLSSIEIHRQEKTPRPERVHRLSVGKHDNGNNQLHSVRPSSRIAASRTDNHRRIS